MHNLEQMILMALEHTIPGNPARHAASSRAPYCTPPPPPPPPLHASPMSYYTPSCPQ
ncbi:hypothetical protein JYU34_020780, partial [Plutella xylostella]